MGVLCGMNQIYNSPQECDANVLCLENVTLLRAASGAQHFVSSCHWLPIPCKNI